MKNSKLLVLTVITTTAINMFNLHQYEVYAASNITPYMTITSNHNFESEITSFSDLGILSKALNIFLTENPQSTEQEQDLFLIKYVESGNFANEKNKSRKRVIKHPLFPFVLNIVTSIAQFQLY